MTQADRIRIMTDEELATMLATLMKSKSDLQIVLLLMWLKHEVEE